MVTGSIFLGLAAVMVFAAITTHRQSLLFLAVGFYAMLSLGLAFSDAAFLVPAVVLAIGLELYGLGLILRGNGKTSESEHRHNAA